MRGKLHNRVPVDNVSMLLLKFDRSGDPGRSMPERGFEPLTPYPQGARGSPRRMPDSATGRFLG